MSNKIKDIFNGKFFTIWEDGEWIYLSTPYCTINFPKSEWQVVKQELQKIGELKK